MNIKKFIRNHPVVSYFSLTFLISWIGAFLLVAHKLVNKVPISKVDGLLMFPILLLGPSLSGITLTGITGGKKAIKDLFTPNHPGQVQGKWFFAVLIPPFVIVFVLEVLSVFVSKEYAPNIFLIGFLFGIPAGILEEIGWMGFAFPHMIRKSSALGSSVLLGLIWGLWHLPVINFLGTASPHGPDWIAYFIAFILVMMGMRVIIAWVYCNTKRLLLSQFMHISSTGFLVLLSPSPMTPKHEPIWYFCYALVLWVLVILITIKYGKNLAASTKLEKS